MYKRTPDLECPYCGHAQDVCNDYGEDMLQEETCHKCEKMFVFRSSISWSYEPHKADCLNGGEHKWESLFCEAFPDHKRCKDCGLEERGKYDKVGYAKYLNEVKKAQEGGKQ